MRKRSRVRLVALIVVLGLPALIAAGVILFVALGGVERRIESEFAARFPGSLRLGRVEVAATDRVLVHDLRLYAPAGGEPIATAVMATIHGNVLAGIVDRIEVNGMRLRIERDFLAWLRMVTAQTGKAESALDLVVQVDGDIAVAQRLPFKQVQATLRFAAGGVDGTIAARLGQGPVALVLTSVTGDGAAMRSTDVLVEALPISTADAFAALHGLGLLDTPEHVLPWLPSAVSLAGTRLRLDPVDFTLRGRLAAQWQEGRLDATVGLERTALAFTELVAADSGLGTAEGVLRIDFSQRDLSLELARWAPGPRLALPARLPTVELLALMPQAGLRIRGGAEQSLQARFHNSANTAWIEGMWQPDQPVRVDGAGMPLSLAEAFLPEGWQIREGVIQGLTVSWRHGLERAVLDVSDLAVATGVWQAVDLDGSIVVAAQDGGYTARLDVPFASLIHRGQLPGGELELTIVDMAGLADHIQGPRRVPNCKGLIKLIASIEVDEAGAVGGTIRHFGCADLTVQGLLRRFAVAGTGRYAWSSKGIDASIDAQCFSGQLRLPGRWLDLASRQPRFTARVISDEQGIAVRDLLARAAEADGTPIAEGFTAGIEGNMDRELNGSFSGVVDRIDLGYLSDRLGIVPLPPGATLTGESAITWNLSIVQGAVQGLQGAALPLGVDLAFLGGKVAIDGIDGAIRFILEPTTPKAP